MRRSIFLFIGALLVLAPLRGQDDYVRFKRITINEGLSLSSVYNIYQDSKGFMWFGTEDGLNRYDGQTITVYGENTEDHNLLADKWIEQIYEDKAGMIWLGSRGGLTMYNPRKGQFTILKHDPADPSTLSNDTISAIVADLLNHVWIGTFRGLNRVDRFTGEAERIIPDENDLVGLMSGISGFIMDPSGNLWIGTEEGLFSHDRKSGLFFNETADGLLDMTEDIHCLGQQGSDLWLGTDQGLIRLDLSGQRGHELVDLGKGGDRPEIKRILVDRTGQVWAQTSRGLYCYRDTAEGPVRILEAGQGTHSLALNPVEPLMEAIDGYIWHGSFGDGVYRIDPVSLAYNHYMHNPADPSSLSENSVNHIFEDRSGAVWFGTFGAGISILDPSANLFSLFKHNPFNINSLASSFIWTIFEDSDSMIWVGSNARGISCFDQRSGLFRHFDHDPLNPRSLAHSSIRKVYQDSRERIWIGTDGGGLGLYQPLTGSFRHFRHDPQDPHSISHNSVRTVYEDPAGRIWVGTRQGLNLMDPASGTFTHYLSDKHDSSSLSHNFIYSALYMDREGQLWVGTYGGGLNRLDPETGQCVRYEHDPDDPTSISGNIIFSIYEDPLGRFWIGTNTGLSMLYPETGSFRRFGIAEGLANEVIYGILPDDQNRIWFSTNLGICRFDLESFEVQNYDIGDGLQSNEFNGGAYHRGRDGRLYFGGVYGMNVIDPNQIVPVKEVGNVTLTKLEVLGKDVRIGDAALEELFEEEPGQVVEFEGDFYTSENITYMEDIQLDFKHRFFSIEFAALNHTQLGKLNYTYIMENLDEEWVRAGTRSYVSYANLRPGYYTFKVLAHNADGFSSSESLTLGIRITPPIWLSWWFILLEIFLALVVAIMIYNYLVKTRTNRLLTYQNQQISQANKALRESEQNLMELNATKDKFFSIISHDLKNPFSSLLSISELMEDSFDDAGPEDHRAGFSKISQSARHLFELLENLLTWSSSQRGKIRYEPVRFNLSTLVWENVNLHRLPAEKKGIRLSASDVENLHAFGDRNMINSVVRNLLTNAVKFTDSAGKVEVRLEQKDREILVSIMDEGIGITRENLEKLFRIDEKFKATGTAGEKGTGLGLIICREFVEKNGGSILVDSVPGKGSTFAFTVPKAN